MLFSHKLIDWYRSGHRDLPWRRTSDPYKIWLSEIILQQTRVAQGLPYYEKFVAHYPTVAHLAAADEQEVLRDWQGLGYYSRARNLHHAAKQVMDMFGGVFPPDYTSLLKLKGVGVYSAAAIASLAFNQPHAVVDGNVYRVLARLFGIREAIDQPAGQRLFREKADALLDREQPGTYNQAIMEFGATLCTPQQPDCANCPFQGDCHAFKTREVTLLPVKAGKIKVRSRYLNYVLFQFEGGIYLKKRTAGDIWQGLYDPFCLEEPTLLETPQLLSRLHQVFGLGSGEMSVLDESADFRHILTHQRLHARFWLVQIFHNLQGNDLIFVEHSERDLFPVPRLITTYFKTIAAWLD